MKKKLLLCFVLFVPSILLLGAKSDWLNNVPAREHRRNNPLHDQTDAAQAGEILYSEHCAVCHGKAAEGRGKHPALRSTRMLVATEGDLHWLLVNGNMRNGMPSWTRMPDPQLWQIVSYLKTLNTSDKEK